MSAKANRGAAIFSNLCQFLLPNWIEVIKFSSLGGLSVVFSRELRIKARALKKRLVRD